VYYNLQPKQLRLDIRATSAAALGRRFLTIFKQRRIVSLF